MPLMLGARQAREPHPSFGALELRLLAWDTAFFGAKLGVLKHVGAAARREGSRDDSLERDLRLALRHAREDGYAHVIFRISSAELRSAWAAQRAGMLLVDVALDSTFSFDQVVPANPLGATLRPARGEDVESLCVLAESAFSLSRFAADPFFRAHQVRAFYREWVANLCAGDADVVLVAEDGDAPGGFVSCTMTDGEGRIPLIATRADRRRRGVGRALVQAALRWFAGERARLAHVKTQAANYPALALYQSSGFTVSSAELTYSIALRPAS